MRRGERASINGRHRREEPHLSRIDGRVEAFSEAADAIAALVPPPEDGEVAVERVAQAMWARCCDIGLPPGARGRPKPWEPQPANVKSRWRTLASAAIAAYIGKETDGDG